MKIKKNLITFLCLLQLINLINNNLFAEIPLYKLNAIKIIYKDNNKIIIADGQATAKDQFGKEISSDIITYDKINNIIKTKSNSKYTDNEGNKIYADDFYYDLNNRKIMALNNVRYQEKNGNHFFFSEFEYYENQKKGFGKKSKALMADKSSFEGEYVQIDNKLKTITIKTNSDQLTFFDKIKSLFKNNNTYTTCKNLENKKSIRDQCPDWSLSTFQTKQDSKKKMVYHDHAVIKIKNIPVFYTPYFSHPDPSVSRKSGFLPPSTKNFSDLGRTFKTPYFWAINDNSDLIFTPIFYQDDNNLYLSEYRKQNKNSHLSLDTSYSSGYKNINKTGNNGEKLNRTSGSRNHFFLNFKGQYDNNLLLGNNDIELSIQRISQKNYLNVNQINTELVKQDINQLSNSLMINSYNKNKKLQITSTIFENLSDDNPNTKYQYKIPYIEYNNFFEKYNFNITNSNLLEANNYNADTKKIIQRNVIQAESKQKIVKKIGASNIFKFKASNLNFYNENVDGVKQNLNNELYATAALETALPLVKYSNNKEEILSPKIFTKTTTGSMKNVSSANKILNFTDLYSLDRLNNIDNPETGNTLGYGIIYELNKKNSNNLNFLKTKFEIGQVLTDTINSKKPRNSSLNERSSNLVGNFNFFLDNSLTNDKNNKNLVKKSNSNKDYSTFDFNYSFNISNDLNKILKNDLNITYDDGINKINSNYYELNDIGSTKYITGNFQRSFNNNFNFLAGIRKNLELDYTENNFIELNYESDCLKIGLNLSKNFYQNDDLKKSKNLTFVLMLKPFGAPFAPDLSNLVNNN